MYNLMAYLCLDMCSRLALSRSHYIAGDMAMAMTLNATSRPGKHVKTQGSAKNSQLLVQA
jgi:hypothetical protein